MVFALQNALHAFVQSLLGDGTILHSFQHGGIGIGKAVGHQQQVCTGLQRLDRRKKTLVEYGFRLPSAFDNRPLKFE